ncbi:hypothetical protein FPQ18DRAFT_346764 [Pyronema domesticum]|nr:hypothetical protein FPQ18DRAFT_346764 [Pyronema domesticum]
MYDDTTASSYTLRFVFPYCKNSCIPYCSKQYYFFVFHIPGVIYFCVCFKLVAEVVWVLCVGRDEREFCRYHGVTVGVVLLCCCAVCLVFLALR